MGNLFKGVGLPADEEATKQKLVVTLDNTSEPKFIVWVWLPSTFKIPGEDEQTTHIPLVGTKEWFAEDKQRCGKTCQVMTADEIDEAFYRKHNMSLEGEIDEKVQKTPENLKKEVSFRRNHYSRDQWRRIPNVPFSHNGNRCP